MMFYWVFVEKEEHGNVFSSAIIQTELNYFYLFIYLFNLPSPKDMLTDFRERRMEGDGEGEKH